MATTPETRPPRSLSHRRGSLVVLGLAVAVAVVYIVLGRTYSDGEALGPSTFPTVLGIVLIGSCLIGVLAEIRRDDQPVVLGNLFQVAQIVLSTAAYLVLWELTGWFYPATFVYLLGLTSRLRGTRPTLHSIGADAIVAATMTLAVYAFFELALGVRF